MIRETLTKTKAVLEERGWGRDWVENDYLPVSDPGAGCVCLATAVALACDYSGDALQIQSFIENDERARWSMSALALQVGWSKSHPPTVVVTSWNDAPGRTKEQVIELIDHTVGGVGDYG